MTMRTVYSKTIEKSCGFLFARWSAGAKAFELTLPPEKRIITDVYAPFYSGKVGTDMVKAMHVINPSIRKGIALRARYFDDYARRCIDDGYMQIVQATLRQVEQQGITSSQPSPALFLGIA